MRLLCVNHIAATWCHVSVQALCFTQTVGGQGFANSMSAFSSLTATPTFHVIGKMAYPEEMGSISCYALQTYLHIGCTHLHLVLGSSSTLLLCVMGITATLANTDCRAYIKLAGCPRLITAFWPQSSNAVCLAARLTTCGCTSIGTR